MLYLLFIPVLLYNNDSKVAFKKNSIQSTSNQNFLLLEQIFVDFFSYLTVILLFLSTPSFMVFPTWPLQNGLLKSGLNKKTLYMKNLIYQRCGIIYLW